MKVALANYRDKLPGPVTAEHPAGRFDIEALAHGTMSLRVYAPRGEDRGRQSVQDTLMIVAAGRAVLRLDEGSNHLAAGEAIFVPAGSVYALSEISDDFIAWLVDWGSAGGEAESPAPSVFAAIDA